MYYLFHFFSLLIFTFPKSSTYDKIREKGIKIF